MAKSLLGYTVKANNKAGAYLLILGGFLLVGSIFIYCFGEPDLLQHLGDPNTILLSGGVIGAIMLLVAWLTKSISFGYTNLNE